MKIFIIHYKKLVERKENIIKQLKIYNLTDYEFIDIDRDELFNYDLGIFDNNYPTHHKAISLSHLKAIEEISKKYESALIFEDDVILCDDFINKYNSYIEQLPLNYDILFIGEGSFQHIPKDKLIENIYI